MTHRIAAACVAGAMAWLLATAALAGVMTSIAGDPVTIDTGKVAGTVASPKVKAYLGIPFAAPPVRANRWRAPQPVTPWKGVYTADETKPECIQGLRSPSINHYFGEEATSEDCLYLNIWAPTSAKPGGKLPVVVWIYGGAFNVGSASSPIYSGESIAAKGVVYVALNYRLGILGFLAHPELTAESGHGASGNWGFLDQVAALKWVQKNIAAFGGDPANVTLAGQSAGSMSINNLQASPLARGLFRRVFGMSGATVRGGPADATGIPLKTAEAAGASLQAAMKASSVADMRSVSADKVMSAAQRGGVRAGPDIDGYFLPESVQHIFETGRQFDVTVVTGSTGNDIGTTPPIRAARDLNQYRALAAQAYGDKSNQFLALWPAADDGDAVKVADQVGRNSGFALGARNWARLQTQTGKQPAYLFMVSRVQPFTPGVTFSDFDPRTAGAYHMSDVPYFLGTYEAFNMFRKTRDWTALDRDLSEKMQNVLVTYAKTGKPNTPDVPFVKYDAAREQRTDFGDRVVVEQLNSKGMDFLFDNPATPPPAAVDPRPRSTF